MALQDKNIDRLKCPVCGGDSEEIYGDSGIYYECDDCGLRLGVIKWKILHYSEKELYDMINRNVPRKPTHIYYGENVCDCVQSCEYDWNFCCKCGQALDWEE